MSESLRAKEPTEAWVVEVCVLGRERTGPWRVQFDNIKSQAEAHATDWNATRPAGYSHRVRRYVPEDALATAVARLEAAERALRFIEDDWRSENWRNCPLSMRTVNAINAYLRPPGDTR